MIYLAGTRFSFDPSSAWDHATYVQIKNKLLSKVKEEIVAYQIVNKGSKYESRVSKMKKWEKQKKKEIQSQRRISKEKRKLEKEMRQQKKDNGEKAFRDWLKRR